MLCCRARLDGYRAALEGAGLALEPDLVVRTELTRDHGRVAALTLLTARNPRRRSSRATTCRHSASTRPPARAGSRIPQDLSVVRFDDLPIAALVDPPPTTVHQPLAEMAVAATELALALRRGEAPVPGRHRTRHHVDAPRRGTAPPGRDVGAVAPG